MKTFRLPQTFILIVLALISVPQISFAKSQFSDFSIHQLQDTDSALSMLTDAQVIDVHQYRTNCNPNHRLTTTDVAPHEEDREDNSESNNDMSFTPIDTSPKLIPQLSENERDYTPMCVSSYAVVLFTLKGCFDRLGPVTYNVVKMADATDKNGTTKVSSHITLSAVNIRHEDSSHVYCVKPQTIEYSIPLGPGFLNKDQVYLSVLGK